MICREITALHCGYVLIQVSYVYTDLKAGITRGMEEVLRRFAQVSAWLVGYLCERCAVGFLR